MALTEQEWDQKFEKKIHDLSYEFPSLTEEEFAGLKARIQVEGQRDPIILFRDTVLDGRHRYRACRELGIEPKFIDYDGDDPAALVARYNRLQGRGLSASQRAAIVVSLLDRDKHQYQNELLIPGTKVNEDGSISTRSYADNALVSKNIIDDLMLVKKDAPDLFEAVRNGDSTVSAASRVLRNREAEIRRTTTAKEDARRQGLDLPTPLVRQGDFSEVLADLTDVDLVFTDPPYPEEYLKEWSKLGEWCAKSLKPGGYLVAYSGQVRFPEVMRRLSEHLTYVWTGWLMTPGAHWSSPGLPVVSNGKPLLFFSNGRPPRKTKQDGEARRDAAEMALRFNDTFTSPERTRDLHEWEQSAAAAEYYIEKMTRPRDLVVDPFLGSGTFGVAAYTLGRKFVGADVDPEAIKTSKKRLFSN